MLQRNRVRSFLLVIWPKPGIALGLLERFTYNLLDCQMFQAGFDSSAMVKVLLILKIDVTCKYLRRRYLYLYTEEKIHTKHNIAGIIVKSSVSIRS